jgi:hypothetical protein
MTSCVRCGACQAWTANPGNPFDLSKPEKHSKCWVPSSDISFSPTSARAYSTEDYQEAGADPSTSNSDPPPEPFTEDAVAEDNPEQKHSPMFTLGGKEFYKGRWLNQLFRDYKNPQAGSQDRLKRVANLPQYGPIVHAMFKLIQCFKVYDSNGHNILFRYSFR